MLGWCSVDFEVHLKWCLDDFRWCRCKFEVCFWSYSEKHEAINSIENPNNLERASDGRLAVRVHPDKASDMVTQLPAGSEYLATGCVGEYLQIQLDVNGSRLKVYCLRSINDLVCVFTSRLGHRAFWKLGQWRQRNSFVKFWWSTANIVKTLWAPGRPHPNGT